MEVEVISGLLAKLDASSLLLVLFSYGVYKLGNRMIDTFTSHGEKLISNVELIRNDIHDLKSSMNTIASQVTVHEQRITSLEKQ
jgi:hypothetical protein